MKKYLLIGLLLFGGIVAYGVYWAFFDLQRLPEGEFLTQSVSPGSTYTVRAYVVDGGATVAYSVRGALVVNDGSKKEKNIYWNYREESAEINWIDDDTVEINGHQLNVLNEKYDFRNSK